MLNRLIALAAKFGTDAERPRDRYHPLHCHMLDVAAGALALWERVLPASVRGMFADDLQLGEEEARKFVAFLAAMHDLGKASWPFQRKDVHAPARLQPLGLLAEDMPDPGHGVVTSAQLCRVLEEWRVPPKVAAELAELAGGHHGFFPADALRGCGANIGEVEADQRARWEEVRSELAVLLMSVLSPPLPKQNRRLSNAGKLALAGLISVADWIGSNEAYFPWAMPGERELALDPKRYFERARKNAARALRDLHWEAVRVDSPRRFRDLFPLIASPRPLQEETERLCAEGAPELLIVEAPMGEGKTEAALRWLEEHAAAIGQGGAYVALPTQATANQLHGRVGSFLKDRFGQEQAVTLMLVHGDAELEDLEFFPSLTRDESSREAETVQPGVAAAEWFLPRKRALLAPYGVGTIDQALLAVLPVRHVFVRLFGLASKPVIVDEVHAYDTYMTGLLERLLEWLGALRAPVALLSATLPSARRRRLLAAYARGRGWEEPAEPPSARYPRLTWLRGGEAGAIPVDPAAPGRRVLLERIPDDPREVAERLRRELGGGGCAAVICNTVARAQEMYRALQSCFAKEELGLLHSRFRRLERSEREERYLALFGRDAVSRPHRFVLVGTQVLEQSLDLDFDLMVTDLAPVDLVLQRMGRLHRHERSQRPIRDARLLIRWPDDTIEEGPRFDQGSAAVYDEHLLLRTWYVLRERASVELPRDIEELIEAVYAEDAAVPEGVPPALQERWMETWKALRATQAKEEELAKDARLPTPTSPTRPADLLRNPREEDDAEVPSAAVAVTRLAEPSVDVVLLTPEDDELAGTLESQPRGERLPRDLTRELLLRSVSVSSKRLYRDLTALEVPPQFRRTPGLRRARLLRVADDGQLYHRDDRGDVRPLDARLDPDLGLEEVTAMPS